MNRNIADELRDNALHLRNSRYAIIDRGGTIASDAGWKDVSEAIMFLPTDVSVSVAATESNSYKVPVPTNSQSVARIESVGGNTRVVPETNLLTEAKRGGIKWSVNINNQENYFNQMLQPGSYRFFAKVETDIPADDDVIKYDFGADVNDYGYTGSGWIPSGAYIHLTEPMYIVPWVGAYTIGDPNVTITQSGGSGPKDLPLGVDNQITIGAGSGDSPTFCTININTNTRVKVVVSRQSFEGGMGDEFFINKGEHSFTWANTQSEDILVEIKVFVPLETLDVTFYPMVYAVPDDSTEYIRTEYEPYTEHIVPTPVTEIVSKGANLWNDVAYLQSHGFELQSDGMWLGDAQWETIFTNDEQREGQISVSYTIELLSIEGTNNYYPIFFYVHYADGTSEQKAPLAYNSTGVQYKRGTSSAGKIVTKIVWGKSQNATFKIKDIMINWGDSPAPYKPYSAEPIDTVAIPEAVKNDAGWGHGFTSTQDGVVWKAYNEYDYSTKTYTQYVPEREILNGSDGHKFTETSLIGSVRRFHYKLKGNCQNNYSVKATRFKTNYANTEGCVYLYKASAYFMLPSNITTVTQANEWLRKNPVEMVYALAEPIVTTIDESTEKFINVEGGGEIVLENDAKAAVPSTITFIRRI